MADILDILREKVNGGGRRRPGNVEHQTQVACVEWFRLTHRDLAPLLFAVPNGGRRDRVTGAKLKAEGVVAGVSDLILLVPRGGYHGLMIEMKTRKGRQQESQKAWQAAVEGQGYRYEVVRSLDEFRETVEDYLLKG